MNTLEHNQQKILRTRDLLHDIIKDPELYRQSNALKSALISQGGLAKYINKELGIIACSLNTYKTASETLFSRGFAEIDQLRKAAKNAIEGKKAKSKPVKGRVAVLEEQVRELKSQLEQERKMTVFLTTINEELTTKLKQAAYSTDRVEVRELAYKEAINSFKAKRAYMLFGEL